MPNDEAKEQLNKAKEQQAQKENLGKLEELNKKMAELNKTSKGPSPMAKLFSGKFSDFAKQFTPANLLKMGGLAAGSPLFMMMGDKLGTVYTEMKTAREEQRQNNIFQEDLENQKIRLEEEKVGLLKEISDNTDDIGKESEKGGGLFTKILAGIVGLFTLFKGGKLFDPITKSKWFQGLSKMFGKFGKFLSPLGKIFGKFGKVLGPLGKIFGKILAPLGAILAIIPMVKDFMSGKGLLEKISFGLAGTEGGKKGAKKGFGKGAGIGAMVGTIFGGPLGTIVGALIGGVVGALLGWIGGPKIKEKILQGMEIFKNTFNILKEKFFALFDAVRNIGTKIKDAFSKLTFEGAVNFLDELKNKIIGGIVEKIKNFANIINTIFKTIFSFEGLKALMKGPGAFMKLTTSKLQESKLTSATETTGLAGAVAKEELNGRIVAEKIPEDTKNVVIQQQSNNQVISNDDLTTTTDDIRYKELLLLGGA